LENEALSSFSKLELKQRLKQALLQRAKKRVTYKKRIPAAVLVPIFIKDGEYYVLFTRRTQTVKEHKGDISFPGGAFQKTDKSLLDTALRENIEEIGLKPSDVEILGELDDTITKYSNYIVSPFVAFIPHPYQFTLNTDEAEELIEIPVTAFFESKYWHREKGVIDNKTAVWYSFHYQGRMIYGATARILKQLVELLEPLMKPAG